MNENLPNEVDKLFNEALQEYKVRPSEETWNKIENKLDEDDRRMVWSTFRWKRYAAAVLLFICLGTAMTIYLRQKPVTGRATGALEKPVTTAAPGKTYSGQTDPETRINPNDQKEIKSNENYVVGQTPGYKKQRGVNRVSGVQNDDSEGYIEHIPSYKMITQSVFFSSGPVPVIEIASPIKNIPDQQQPIIIHQKTRFKDRLSITPYFSQEFAGYSLTDNDLTGVNGQEIEERERNVFSASVGFYVNYKINKKWVLQTGISYSWSNSNIDSAISYAVKDDHGNVQFKVNTISGYGYLQPATSIQPNVGDSVYTAKSYSQLHYLSVPLVLSYHISMKRFSLLIGAGGTFNVLTSAQLETKTYGNGNPEKKYIVNMLGLKKINYGTLVKFDLEYHINSELGLNIMPCFKNTLSPINLESPVSAYPYNVGIGIGLTYRF
jgi:hypothetical protein